MTIGQQKQNNLIDTPEDSTLANKIYGVTNKLVHSQKWGNDYIRSCLIQSVPFAAGKIGGIECSAMQEYLRSKKKASWFKPMWWSTLASALYNNAGVFPETAHGLDHWAREYSDSLIDIDLMGVWSPQFQEDHIIKEWAFMSNLCATRALEPFYHSQPWTRALESKKVLIISPFVKTIGNQYKNKTKVWNNLEKDINPDFDIKFLKCPLSPALQAPTTDSWLLSLKDMCDKIENIDFDVALIGAGAYSLPLCSFIKNKEKSAIHLGGGLQVMFGVKGNRWLSHDIINKLFNEHWVFPSEDETPKNTHIVEGSCYWK
jgi:hypothetical protein|tara:strand:- start:26484 stop:27431 length:948 start_codon:yes stop_codon:yes gene_type:complete